MNKIKNVFNSILLGEQMNIPKKELTLGTGENRPAIIHEAVEILVDFQISAEVVQQDLLHLIGKAKTTHLYK